MKQAGDHVDPSWLSLLRVLRDDTAVQRGVRWLREQAQAITDLQVEFAELPSPDLRAAPRAQLFLRWLRDLQLHGVHQDEVGNVIGTLPGTDRSLPFLVLSAHLDSVFPHLDTIRVQRQGNVYRAPGIADDAAGLAGVLFLMQAVQRCGFQPARDVVVVATVGEEGEGDLAGVKHLFAHTWQPDHVAAFLTLDLGSPAHTAHAALGSRRFEARVDGPGGHSWGDFGRPNPVHALSRGVAAFLAACERSAARESGSWNVGRIEGGQSVNAIPESARLSVDLRSREPGTLDELVTRFEDAMREGVLQEQNAARSLAADLQLHLRSLGDRPTGETPLDAALVRAVFSAFALCDLPLAATRSSTDANVPMSLGVPALALPHGARAYNAHSDKEWCDVTGREDVLVAELLAVLALAS